jgi:hypothetical protein
MDLESDKQDTKIKDWVDLINESVHTADDADIGDIDAVSRDFVVVKKGIVNIHYYYIPISKVEGWDGRVLWLKIIESEVKGKYERDKVPDPTLYYVKDYPYYKSTYYPELQLIALRHTQNNYPVTSPPATDVPHLYKCGFCDNTFTTEDELSDHIISSDH